MSIWFCGDVHGNFDHVLEHFLRVHGSEVSGATNRHSRSPKLVFLGDLQCRQSLEEELSEIRGLADIYFIPGNHDTDSYWSWNALAASQMADRNLHGRVKKISDWKVAGLGGVFRSSIWSPPSEPIFNSYKEFRKYLIDRRPPKDWGLAETTSERRHLSTIFPDAVHRLGKERAQILVTHEAPGSCHEFGWSAIDQLARQMRVSYLFHGHLHETRIYPYCGFQAVGVGYRAIIELDGNGLISVIRPGDYDNEGGLCERGEDDYE